MYLDKKDFYKILKIINNLQDCKLQDAYLAYEKPHEYFIDCTDYSTSCFHDFVDTPRYIDMKDVRSDPKKKIKEIITKAFNEGFNNSARIILQYVLLNDVCGINSPVSSVSFKINLEIDSYSVHHTLIRDFEHLADETKKQIIFNLDLFNAVER